MAKENVKEDNEEALQMKSPGSHHLCSGAGQRQDDGWLPLVLFLLPRLPLPTRAEGTGVALQTCFRLCHSAVAEAEARCGPLSHMLRDLLR